MTQPPIQISPVPPAQIPATVQFVMQARAMIFPMLDATVLPADLRAFSEVYLSNPLGKFLIARQGDTIVGAIGYLPYDHRFAQLDYAGKKVVEVVRLFVSPQCRGAGLAGRLYSELKAHAQEAGVQVLYLHTHPFLPGAIPFWEKHGFAVVDIETDPVWQTTHMACQLG